MIVQWSSLERCWWFYVISCFVRISSIFDSACHGCIIIIRHCYAVTCGHFSWEYTRLYHAMWKMTAWDWNKKKSGRSTLENAKTAGKKLVFYCRKRLRRRVLYVCTCRHFKKIQNFLEHMFTTLRQPWYHKSMHWYCMNFHWYLWREQKD